MVQIFLRTASLRASLRSENSVEAEELIFLFSKYSCKPGIPATSSMVVMLNTMSNSRSVMPFGSRFTGHWMFQKLTIQA